MYQLFFFTILFCFLGSVVAGSTDINKKYKQTDVVIKNETTHDEKVSLAWFKGRWMSPLSSQAAFILKPNQTFEDTLISVVSNGNFESDMSFAVYQVEDPKENYLIFGADLSSAKHSVSGDIFDGLGDMFVDSDTNYCATLNPAGYPVCQLVIKSRS